jgi:Fatty acid cis/trans isomerase (CTI).
MSYRVISAVLLFLSWGAAAQDPAISSAISYSRDIQPIFTEKCVACHACYDSACQLNLGSGEGAARGATKVPVYDGERRQAAAPTRLFYDAFGKRAWQQKDFYSVLDAQGSQAALMARMLELGHKTPLTPNARLPEEIVLGLNRGKLLRHASRVRRLRPFTSPRGHAARGHRPDRPAVPDAATLAGLRCAD